jgi:hypothetical protein
VCRKRLNVLSCADANARFWGSSDLADSKRTLTTGGRGRKPPLTKTNESTLTVSAPKNGAVFGLGF